MSGRYHDYDKGSSRSTRDDSRLHMEKHGDRDKRTRSRSPRRRSSPTSQHSSAGRSSSSRERDRREHEEQSNRPRTDWDSSEEEVPAPPPPPRISKISNGFNKSKAPIKMNFGGPAKPVAKPTVASVFTADDDDDDEPEEMPAEARMRMRNIGRETPTSAGPNSFGKTKQGFCDAKKVFEKNLKQALDMADKPAVSKLPQTIYKIKGP